MIKSITVTNFLGESLDIKLAEANPAHGLLIREIEGLGPTKADINTTANVLFDGSVFNSSRLNERNIVIDFILYAYGGWSIEDSRQLVYKYFPIKNMVGLYFETDNRSVATYGYVESVDPDIFSDMENVKVSIICPDAYFKLASRETKKSISEKSNLLSNIERSFHFPFPIESLPKDSDLLYFGNYSGHMYDNSYTYIGEIETGFIFKVLIRGPLEYDLKLYQTNNSVNRKIVIDIEAVKNIIGTYPVLGDEILISSIIGNKGVWILHDGKRYDILDSVDYFAISWFTLYPGNNLFAIDAGEHTHNVEIEILSEVLYAGI